MQVKSIADGSKGSILQCFQPSLSYNLFLRSLLNSLFLSGRFNKTFYTGIQDNMQCPLLVYVDALHSANNFSVMYDVIVEREMSVF